MCAHAGRDYLVGRRAENAGGSADEVPDEEGETRQAEEEEPGGAGADDCVDDILVTHRHTHLTFWLALSLHSNYNKQTKKKTTVAVKVTASSVLTMDL